MLKETILNLINYNFSNLLIYNLQHKDETTITFAVKIIEIVNKMSLNMCLMAFVNTTYLDDYITFCATVLHSKFTYFFINIFIYLNIT